MKNRPPDRTIVLFALALLVLAGLMMFASVSQSEPDGQGSRAASTSVLIAPDSPERGSRSRDASESSSDPRGVEDLGLSLFGVSAPLMEKEEDTEEKEEDSSMSVVAASLQRSEPLQRAVEGASARAAEAAAAHAAEHERQRREAEHAEQHAREREVAAAARSDAARAPTPTKPSEPQGASGRDSVWHRLAACESGGNWAANTGNGYYGGLQFLPSTWRSVGGTGLPHQHSAAEQIKRGKILQQRSGWGQWPACSRKIGVR